VGTSIPEIFKRKGSQNWWAKRQTPADLWREKKRLQAHGIKLLQVIWQSMGTPIKRDALAKLAAFYSQTDEEFERWRKLLRDGPTVLDDQQQWAITKAITEGLLKRREAKLGSSRDWINGTMQDRWRKLLGLPSDGLLVKTLHELIEVEVRKHKLVLAAETRIAIGHKLVGYDPVAAQEEVERREAGYAPRPIDWPDDGDLRKTVSLMAKRAATGDYRQPDFLAGRPDITAVLGRIADNGFSFEALVGNWENHGRGIRKPSPASLRKYRSQATAFSRFLGHDAPASVTQDDAQRYLEHVSMLHADGSKPAQRTVWSIMTNLSTLYAKAIKAGKLADNPFTKSIPPKQDRGERIRMRSFTDEEAAMVLAATRLEQDTFRRWGPWLMAYSGMRVTEASQLRVIDVEVVDSKSAFIHIRHEAGHVKNGTNRIVPLHAALRREGFLKFVSSVQGERLFPQVCLDSRGQRFDAKGAPNDSKAHKLSKWIWTLGLKQEANLAPNHAWRHRFEVVATKAGLQQIAIDRIVGHTDNHVRAGYQNDDLRELLVKAMSEFPSIKLK
jgi:integrase